MIKLLRNLILKDILLHPHIHRELWQLYKNQEALDKRLDVLEKSALVFKEVKDGMFYVTNDNGEE